MPNHRKDTRKRRPARVNWPVIALLVQALAALITALAELVKALS